jgi:hypothetical protein
LLIVIIFVSRLLWFVDAPYHAEPRTTGFYFFFPLHRPGENQIQSRRNNRLITATAPEKLNSRGMSNFSATPNFRQFQGLIHLSLVEVRENHCGRPQVSSLSDGHLNHQDGDFSSQHRYVPSTFRHMCLAYYYAVLVDHYSGYPRTLCPCI